MQRGLDWNTENIDADVVHLHTWYTHLAGIMAKLNYGLPMVLTVHSLEPLRPWKREQLGGGYDFSCWVEKTAIEMADAVIAVSAETKADILRLFDVAPEKVHIIYNGIDLHEYQPVVSTSGAREIRRRSKGALRALRRPDRAAKGHRPSGAGDPVFCAGFSSRALRRRAGYAGDRRGNARRGRSRASRARRRDLDR